LIFQDAPGTGLNRPTRTGLSVGALARAFYFNDQRIEWSGQEATFGTEAIGVARYYQGDACNGYGGAAELYLQQPYERNILVDNQERQSYRANFEHDVLQVSQLYADFRQGSFYAAAGKFTTPFGRTYFPIMGNSRIDAPFIRSEAILWRETGVLMRYSPSAFNITAALTNGGYDLDTNSSKAFVGRIAYDGSEYAFGASAKIQDGIGSENQKTFNSHIGIDAMRRFGGLVVSTEVIYDQYGLRRGYDPNEIFWGRNIYYRDTNKAYQTGIYGVGYYIDATYLGDSWLLGMNFGQYFPEQIGVAQHDADNHRGILRAAKRLSEAASIYTQTIIESDLPNAQAGRTRRGKYLLAGVMLVF
jgi:hypothetical protein